MYIVGIDIAKRKHEAVVIDRGSNIVIKPFSFANNCSGYNRLIDSLRWRYFYGDFTDLSNSQGTDRNGS